MPSIFRLSNIVSEIKQSVKLAIPLVAAEVIYGLNSFIATVMISHLGKEQLAANALVWSFYVAMLLFFMGFFFAVGVMVAQSFGAKDNHGIGICFKQGLIMAFMCSIPMMVIIWMAPVILVWTRQDPVVITYAKPFFHSLIWCMLPLNIWVAMQQFLTGINKARIVMFMCIMSVPIEVLFYYIFLFGKFGFPKLGLAGIGYGLTASYYTISLFFGCYLYFSKQFKNYSLFKKWWVIEYKFFVEIIRVGLPLGFMYCSELAFFAVIAIDLLRKEIMV